MHHQISVFPILLISSCVTQMPSYKFTAVIAVSYKSYKFTAEQLYHPYSLLLILLYLACLDEPTFQRPGYIVL